MYRSPARTQELPRAAPVWHLYQRAGMSAPLQMNAPFGSAGAVAQELDMTLAARIFIARVQAASRKAARKRRSDLERELAGYATPAERGDLEATLDRYPYGTTHELRGILARQSMADDIRSRHRQEPPSRH